jgi:hypothetical protein
MLRGLLTNTEKFFWAMVWVFLLLIAGYAVLAFLRNRFGGDVIGNLAQGIQNRAQPQA